MKTNYPKLDIFINGKYICTTTWAKTNKEAKAALLKAFPDIDAKTVSVSKGVDRWN